MNRMKGMELPINMIIIIAIAVLVFVVVAAYFSGAFIGDSKRVAAQASWNAFCGQERVRGCPDWNTVDNLDVGGVSTAKLTVCSQATGLSSTDGPGCKASCCGS
jgi:hypothetical protein